MVCSSCTFEQTTSRLAGAEGLEATTTVPFCGEKNVSFRKLVVVFFFYPLFFPVLCVWYGFLLSVAAVASIAVFFRLMERTSWYHLLTKQWRVCLACVGISFFCWVGTMPLLIHMTGSWVWISPMSNIILTPFIFSSVILGLIVFLLLLIPLPGMAILSMPVIFILQTIFSFLVWLVDLLSRCPPCPFSLSFEEVCFVYLIMFVGLFCFEKKYYPESL